MRTLKGVDSSNCYFIPYLDREMILADECLIRGDESGAVVYSHIANVIHARQRNNES